jgi:hypothetical protein
MRFQNWWPADLGDKRISSWFALIPVTLGNETRWLERVTVEWQVENVAGLLPPCLPTPAWVKVRFVEKDLRLGNEL